METLTFFSNLHVFFKATVFDCHVALSQTEKIEAVYDDLSVIIFIRRSTAFCVAR